MSGAGNSGWRIAVCCDFKAGSRPRTHVRRSRRYSVFHGHAKSQSSFAKGATLAALATAASVASRGRVLLRAYCTNTCFDRVGSGAHLRLHISSFFGFHCSRGGCRVKHSCSHPLLRFRYKVLFIFSLGVAAGSPEARLLFLS